MAYLVFDIGGTNTRIALSLDGEQFGAPRKFATPKNFADGIALIARHASELATEAGAEITAAAGGIAGPLSRDRMQLVRSPNLPDWVGKPLAEKLREAIGAPVAIENDSAMVGLGEAHAGAGQGFSIMAYITVSTGVGGVRIVEGRIDQSAFGFEPGHQVIDMDGNICEVCESGEAEDLLSGTATEIRFGKKAYQVADPAAWEELARWSAIMLNNTIVHWSPHAVVLGGSMIVGNPAISVDRIAHYLRKTLTIFPELPEIRPAILKDEGGLHGALAYLRGAAPQMRRE